MFIEMNHLPESTKHWLHHTALHIEPVFIIEHGQITNVVLNYQQYQQLQHQHNPKSLHDVFAQYHPACELDIEFEREQQDLRKTEFD